MQNNYARIWSLRHTSTALVTSMHDNLSKSPSIILRESFSNREKIRYERDTSGAKGQRTLSSDFPGGGTSDKPLHDFLAVDIMEPIQPHKGLRRTRFLSRYDIQFIHFDFLCYMYLSIIALCLACELI